MPEDKFYRIKTKEDAHLNDRIKDDGSRAALRFGRGENDMKTRYLGSIPVSEIGMGCMGFSHGYGQIPPEEYSIKDGFSMKFI